MKWHLTDAGRKKYDEWNERRLNARRGPTEAEIAIGERLRYLMIARKPWPTCKQLGMVVPKTARCRECGVTGDKLTDPDEWACTDFSSIACCAACAKKLHIEGGIKDRTPDPVRVIARKAGAFKTPAAVLARHKSTPRVRKLRAKRKDPPTGNPCPEWRAERVYDPRERPSRAKQITLFEAGLREPRQKSGVTQSRQS